MSGTRAHVALFALWLATGACAAHTDIQHDDILFNITEAEFFEMPRLFELDDWEGCLSARGVYCVGTFELAPAPAPPPPPDSALALQRDPAAPRGHELFDRMRRYSANWVDNYNHTLLHRGYCLPRRCARPRHDTSYDAWFSSCVNASTVPLYGLAARLQRAGPCEAGPRAPPPPRPAYRALLALSALLVGLAAVSTVLDIVLSDHAKKSAVWQCALAWSVPGCWRALTAAPPPPPPGGAADLRAVDGLRVFCVLCVVCEHVCWITAQTFIDNVWQFEQFRHDPDVMLMINSTLVVQVFFLMSSFLLAHKLLQQRRKGQMESACKTFFETLINRIIRVSPSYYFTVWFAAAWWERVGAGPLWGRLVSAEAAICRRKWWTHLLYLNNILYADDKCLIQTWYLAADMQLYVFCLALTLLLRRYCRSGAIVSLALLLAAAIATPLALAYIWSLLPTYVMHQPELVRNIYAGESSFNVLYQSPVSNAAGSLAGLLLAHLHHHLVDSGVHLHTKKWFRVLAVWSPLLSVVWAAGSPALLGRGPPHRVSAALLAATERPIFSFFVAAALLGAFQGVDSPLRRMLSWSGWVVPARLSFGVLLLHMPFNKAMVASRLSESRVDRYVAFVDTFGIAAVSFLLAVPLALVVELPAQRLYRAARLAGAPPPAPAPAPAKTEGAPLQDKH